jgi:SHS2 domain-containing protein
VHGEPLDPGRHRVGTVVKGATYHGASVRSRETGGWDVRVIVDI